MKYLEFHIEGYRAVKHADIAVSNNLIPIIGVNESGKTTVLQAILAFDKNKDRYNRGSHLNHKNKYELKEQPCKISATILIESTDDIDFLSQKMGLTTDSPLLKKLQEYQNKQTPIVLSRTFPGKKYEVENEGLLKVANKRQQTPLANALYEKLPFILYFDDFSDRVPKTIEFPLLEGGKNLALNSSVGEWHSILEEVFKRATDGQQTLADFLKMSNKNDQDGLMSDIIDILHKDVVEDWKNLKKQYGSDFANEPEDLKLKLEWKITDDNSKVVFEFQVEDRTFKQRGRYFNIVDRSKGFQWFFNFIMKLKFNPKYKEDQKGAIYLLDEPGSYLHTSAQGELLKKLQDISNTNTILYCTHSQYLLDPEVINIARIKIAKKEGGEIQALSFNETGVSNTAGALTPLYQALHLKAGTFDRRGDYSIVTEGITDFYLFNLLKKNKKGSFKEEIDFIPGAGAQHLKDLISNAIAFSKAYLVLLDSDKEGRDAYENYREYFGDSEAVHFFKYRTKKKEEDVLLEDLLSKKDQKKICDLTGVADVKSAIPVLFYGDEKEQKDFLKNLDDESLGNLKIIEEKVNGIMKKTKKK